MKYFSAKFLAYLILCMFCVRWCYGQKPQWLAEEDDGPAGGVEFVISTNFYGVTVTNVPVVMTNEWGLVETNLVDILSLKPVSSDLVVTADLLTYDRSSDWVEARGHVVIAKGGQELSAVYARVNRNTGDAYAAGNVVLRQGNEVWEGAELTYNFHQKTGVAGNVAGFSSPFRVIKMDSAEKGTTNEAYLIHNLLMTTCTNDYPSCHFHIRAGDASLIPDVKIEGKGAWWYFGNVPMLYLPFWKIDLREDFGWSFQPGHNSRMGAVLLTSYKYRINPVFRGKTHVDYRSLRGVGLGQDLLWNITNGIPALGITRGSGEGEIQLYYLNDERPMDASDAGKTSIDEDRYRVLLKNRYNLSSSDYTMLRLNYLSDTDVLDDFFEDEYRLYHIPENYFIYTHRGERYTAGLAFRSRLNDFFGGVNRLPEASFEFMPQLLLDGANVFYDGRTSLANLERVYEKDAIDVEDYSIMRFDTLHNFSRPSKHFGFLTVVPRASYRGTYFSKTKDTTNLLEVVAVTGTNAVDELQTNLVSQTFETDAMYRNLFEFGAQASFKMMKLYGGDIKPRRHIIEPYINHTYIPEPNVLPDHLYQFDSIDGLANEHSTRIGARNKIQKKIKQPLGYSPFDILDVDIYTVYNIDREEGTDPFQNVWFDAEWRPCDYFTMDSDARWSLVESALDTFSIRAYGIVPSTVRSSLEFRYRADRSSLLFGDISLFPGRIGWNPSVYARYEFEDDRLEEVGMYLRRTLDCMVCRAGLRFMPGYTATDGTDRSDDFRVTFELWLTAFPEMGVKRDEARRYGGSYEY